MTVNIGSSMKAPSWDQSCSFGVDIGGGFENECVVYGAAQQNTRAYSSGQITIPTSFSVPNNQWLPGAAISSTPNQSGPGAGTLFSMKSSVDSSLVMTGELSKQPACDDAAQTATATMSIKSVDVYTCVQLPGFQAGQPPTQEATATIAMYPELSSTSITGQVTWNQTLHCTDIHCADWPTPPPDGVMVYLVGPDASTGVYIAPTTPMIVGWDISANSCLLMYEGAKLSRSPPSILSFVGACYTYFCEPSLGSGWEWLYPVGGYGVFKQFSSGANCPWFSYSFSGGIGYFIDLKTIPQFVNLDF
jgi:hypothetical protein